MVSGAPALARGFDHRRQAALERAAIVEPGQRVVQRHLDRLLHGLAQSIRVALLADVCPHPGQELVSVDRAGEVVVDAEFEAAKHLRAIVRIGDEQDRQIARALVRAGLAAQPQAVERAEPRLDDHEVDCLFARRRPAPRPAPRRGSRHDTGSARRRCARDELRCSSTSRSRPRSDASSFQRFGRLRSSRLRAMRGASCAIHRSKT